MKAARQPVLFNLIALLMKLILKALSGLLPNGLSPPQTWF
jgi:hypothetical protein